jgi:hypothetical protein
MNSIRFGTERREVELHLFETERADVLDDK